VLHSLKAYQPIIITKIFNGWILTLNSKNYKKSQTKLGNTPVYYVYYESSFTKNIDKVKVWSYTTYYLFQIRNGKIKRCEQYTQYLVSDKSYSFSFKVITQILVNRWKIEIVHHHAQLNQEKQVHDQQNELELFIKKMIIWIKSCLFYFRDALNNESFIMI